MNDNGKSENDMDDLGVLPFLGHLHVYSGTMWNMYFFAASFLGLTWLK